MIYIHFARTHPVANMQSQSSATWEALYWSLIIISADPNADQLASYRPCPPISTRAPLPLRLQLRENKTVHIFLFSVHALVSRACMYSYFNLAGPRKHDPIMIHTLLLENRYISSQNL